MSKMIIHIGLHKTGTTFLQKQYFPNFREINYYTGNLILDDFGFNKKHDSFLISNESLSGRPWNSEWKRGIKNDFRYIESFKTAIDNLKIIFPQALIVVVFRKHGDLLLSLYKQYIQEGGIFPFKDFYNDEGVIRDEDLYFVDRVNYLKEHFKNVHVLSFEEFKSGGIDYYNKFFISIGCKTGELRSIRKENSSISGQKIEILRKVNKHYPYSPEKIKNLLALGRLTPRRILQERLSFWNSPDSEELIQIKSRINKKFEADWEQIEKQFFK